VHARCLRRPAASARGRLAAQLDLLESPVVPAVNSKSLEVR
jgi:hypothetical protein